MTRANLGAAIAIAAAGLTVAAIFGEPGSGRAAGSGPTNTGTPTISGIAQEGQALGASTGTWNGNPTAFTYAWSRCDENGGSCSPIAGGSAGAPPYTPIPADVGHTLRVTVLATGPGGSTQATSAPSPVISNAGAPTPTTVPAISGTTEMMSTLTASKGAWSGSPTAFAFGWSRCDGNGNSCATIDGATSDTHTVSDAAAGATLRLSVTATDAKNDATTWVSAPTAAVPPAGGCPAGSGSIGVQSMAPPARLSIDSASIAPKLVTLGTHRIQLHVKVTACHGRPVQGATVFASPIPYNQFAGPARTTNADGTATLTEERQSGFPARRNDQHLLAVFIRATRPGDPVLGGVSTRRTVAFRVTLP
jgi:hypothetical protein